MILFCTVVAPALLRIDLRAECAKLEQALGMSAPNQVASGWRKFELRAYRLPDGSPLAGLTVTDAEACPSTGCSSTGRRDGRILAVDPGMTLQPAT